MEQINSNVGHPTLRVEDIEPSKADSFSPNLFKYLKKHGLFYSNGGLLDGVYIVKPDTKAAKCFGVGTLLLGYYDEDFFIGTRLMSALCNGTKAERGAYPCGTGAEIVHDFWSTYLKIGRCAIDPEHSESFINGDRYSIMNDVRLCRWCGKKHQKIVTPRTIYDESWVAI